jgi:hypothetical protein
MDYAPVSPWGNFHFNFLSMFLSKNNLRASTSVVNLVWIKALRPSPPQAAIRAAKS